MSEATMSIDVAFSERERFTLSIFFSGTYKPKNKVERRAMRLAFRRLKLDEIIDRLRKPGGINQTMLSDVQTVVPLNEETINWVIANLNPTGSESADSLILADLEERFDDVKAGTYVVPPNAVKPKAVLTSVPVSAPTEEPAS